MQKSILLFNPRAANYKPRIPNSVLSIASSISPEYEILIVDGNLEDKPLDKMLSYLSTKNILCIGFTVMPGPQLQQAIPFANKIKQIYPDILMVWGGYFPSNQPLIVLESGFVDVIVNGIGNFAFNSLLSSINNRSQWSKINNLIFLENGILNKTPKSEIPDPDELSPLNYEMLNRFYPLKKYLGKTYLGTRTIAYHSSFGCPFTCSFCAVVPIYQARWKGMSAKKMMQDLNFLFENFNGNAIEFHDNNFFVSEKRCVEFANLVMDKNIYWWGEARIDTMDKFSDESLKLLAESGCKMIFFGAESGDDAQLKTMDKGGQQSATQILNFAARLRKFNIIPEYSFVLGTPPQGEKTVLDQINHEINFIRNVKKTNPDTEIIIYTYSPVPNEGSKLYDEVKKNGFKFPQKLEDWINPEWINFDLRKNPLTPWLTSREINRIKNFETVLNARFPTKTDIRLSPLKRKLLVAFGSIRYWLKFYYFPYELRLLMKIWKYRQPEKEGF